MNETKIHKLMGLKKQAAMFDAVTKHLQNFKPGETAKKALPMMGLLGAFALLDKAVIPGAASVATSIKEPFAWKKAVKRDPSLAEDPLMREHFKAIYAMAPKMMGYPSFSVPVLQRTREYGTSGIPIDMALNIAKVAPPTSAIANPGAMAFARALMDAGSEDITSQNMPIGEKIENYDRDENLTSLSEKTIIR